MWFDTAEQAVKRNIVPLIETPEMALKTDWADNFCNLGVSSKIYNGTAPLFLAN